MAGTAVLGRLTWRVADVVDVMAVYLSEDQRVAGDYARRLGLTFTQLPDPAAEISAAYGVRAIPAHYFVDGQGIVRDVAVGALSESQIDGHLDRLVGRDAEQEQGGAARSPER